MSIRRPVLLLALAMASVVTAASSEATIHPQNPKHGPVRGLHQLQMQVENSQEEMPSPAKKTNAHTASPLFLLDSSPAKNGLRKMGMDMAKYSNLLQTVRKANGNTFTVENFLEHGAQPFVLSAYEVFAENAKILQQNADGSETVVPRPEMVHLHGSIAGESSSFVVMHLCPTGSFGLIERSSGRMSIESDLSGHSVLLDAAAVQEDDLTAKEIFAAQQEYAEPDELQVPASDPKLHNAIIDHVSGDEEADEEAVEAARAALAVATSHRVGSPTILLDAPPTKRAPKAKLLSASNNNYEINMAIDCDQACVARLNQYAPGSGQGTDAATYLTALIAGTAVVYRRDLGRDLKITHMKLWATASPFDSGTNSLNQYRSYYTSNDAPSVNYDVAHLMTGIQEGGVAYLNTVCTTSGYNVGVSSLRGQWQGTTSGSSAYIWDLEVTAHELGHNFGSGHSHDYSPPIDECVSCRAGYSEAQCQTGGNYVGPVSRSDPRCVKGTIMSYCHLCGGMENINMHFHPRAITRIQEVLNSNCGVVTGTNAGGGGGVPATASPTNPPTVPLPTNAPTVAAPTIQGTCTPRGSVAQCGECQTGDQCAAGFCCPYMKKCVASSSTGCYYPIANCRPMCYDSAAAAGTCSCQNSDWPNNWAGPTCTTAPPTDAPTPAPPTPAPPTDTPTSAPEPEPTDAPTDAPTTTTDRRSSSVPTDTPTDAPTDAPINVTQSVEIYPRINDWDDSHREAFRKAIVDLLRSLTPPVIVNPSDITFNEVRTTGGVTTGSGELLSAAAVVAEPTSTSTSACLLDPTLCPTTVNYNIKFPADTDTNTVTTGLDSAAAGTGSSTNTLTSHLAQHGIPASSTNVAASAAVATQAPTMSGASANSMSRVAMIASIMCSIVAWL